MGNSQAKEHATIGKWENSALLEGCGQREEQ